MRKLGLVIILLGLQFSVFGQILKFDELEMRYDQGNYKSVYRKASNLIANPDYDFSYIPRYYLAMSKFQLAQNKKWLKKKKNANALEEAAATIREMRKVKEGQEVLRAHLYEISAMKSDLMGWMLVLQEAGDKERFNQVKRIVDELFVDVPVVSSMKEDALVVDKETKESNPAPAIHISAVRANMIKVGEGQLGVPYVYAGASPSGFDCSGFTSYVYEHGANMKITRSSKHQYKEAKKLKKKDVQPGDLIFFNNGSGGEISHVGMVYSTNNGSIQMIHASSSKGISIVDIYSSSYWTTRIIGFGTFLKE